MSTTPSFRAIVIGGTGAVGRALVNVLSTSRKLPITLPPVEVKKETKTEQPAAAPANDAAATPAESSPAVNAEEKPADVGTETSKVEAPIRFHNPSIEKSH